MNQTAREKAASQCVEEAALLWLRREHLMGEPHLTLCELVERDRQLQARLDELAAAGELGWRACERELEWEEPGEIFPATFLALAVAVDKTASSRLAHVLAYAVRTKELTRPLVAALAWVPLDGIMNLLEDLFTANDARLRRVGLAAAVAHRQIPESVLSDALDDRDGDLRARAMRGVGEMGYLELLPRLAEQMADESAACRFEAAWSCALRSRSLLAIEVLFETAESQRPDSERAMRAVARLLDACEGSARLQSWGERPAMRRAAIVGAGVLGNPALIDWLIAQLTLPATARLAGESLELITGISLDRPPFQAHPPEAMQRMPCVCNPWEEAVEAGPDEHLPWPNRQAVADWWIKHRTEYQSGHRYLLGRPISDSWCRTVLREGRQRQRAHAALELATRHPAEILFDVRAPGMRQRTCLEPGVH
ncbi:MAG: TIGR02270 family protein [Pirellulaceae bacterium]